ALALCAAAGGRSGEAADQRQRDAPATGRDRAAHPVLEGAALALSAHRGRRGPRRGRRRGVRFRGREAPAPADPALPGEQARAGQRLPAAHGRRAARLLRQDRPPARRTRAVRRRRRTALVATACVVLAVPSAGPYPLDGYESTGIRRLLGLRLAQQGLVKDSRLPKGASLGVAEVDLRLLGRRDFDPPPPHPRLPRPLGALPGTPA